MCIKFDEATGYMIGKKDKGLNAMFTMMNLERIVVGIQGLGISEIAYQNSHMQKRENKVRLTKLNQLMVQIL